MDKKIVYVIMSGDHIHSGHISVVEKATTLGEVTVGLLTDKALAKCRREPTLSFAQRKQVIAKLNGVSKIIPQDGFDCTRNLKKIRPQYVVHGDDWQKWPLKSLKEMIITTLKNWGGELVEVEYSKELTLANNERYLAVAGTTPDCRRGALRTLLSIKSPLRIMEVHNGITGLIVENTSVTNNDKSLAFDGMWVSSLTDSFAKGKPDTQCVDFSSRVDTINQILEVTTKLMIVDGDSGGLAEHFCYMVKTLERLGVSAVIIEDKTGLKRNSLFGTDAIQQQDNIEDFCFKIREGKKAQATNDFMIIARIESFISGKNVEDAITRAKAYIAAGADGIMIHSKEKTPDEIFAFCDEYEKFPKKVPLVLVPTTYSSCTEEELAKRGANIIIYANHLLRSGYPAMVKTAETILRHGRSQEADDFCIPIKKILNLIPGNK
jgi:phosphoenolpyruvate phosphomutase